MLGRFLLRCGHWLRWRRRDTHSLGAWLLGLPWSWRRTLALLQLVQVPFGRLVFEHCGGGGLPVQFEAVRRLVVAGDDRVVYPLRAVLQLGQLGAFDQAPDLLDMLRRLRLRRSIGLLLGNEVEKALLAGSQLRDHVALRVLALRDWLRRFAAARLHDHVHERREGNAIVRLDRASRLEHALS